MTDLSPKAHAAILLKVASKTLSEARQAWRHARFHPDEVSLRAAFRACVLASRTSRKAAEAWSNDAVKARRLTDEAKKLDTAANDLRSKLAAVTA